MTTSQAKTIIKQAIESRGLQFAKLTAKTVDFTDLARCSRIFVKVHGWQPNPAWSDLQAIAKTNGFCVEA